MQIWQSCLQHFPFFISAFDTLTHNEMSSRGSQALVSMSLILHCTNINTHILQSPCQSCLFNAVYIDNNYRLNGPKCYR